MNKRGTVPVLLKFNSSLVRETDTTLILTYILMLCTQCAMMKKVIAMRTQWYKMPVRRQALLVLGEKMQIFPIWKKKKVLSSS